MPGVEDDINLIKAQLADSKLIPETTKVSTIANNDAIGFHSSALGKIVWVTFSEFLQLITQGTSFSIIPDPDDNDFTLIQQNGITQLRISRVGVTGQYTDIINRPQGSNSLFTEVDGFRVRKRSDLGNINYGSIEVGDVFWGVGYGGNFSRYIMARVNSTPYTNEANISIIQEDAVFE